MRITTPLFAALFALSTSPYAASAQGAAGGLAVQRAALEHYQKLGPTLISSGAMGRRLLLDPTILPLSYDNGLRRGGPATTPRDSAQSRLLATSLGGSVATPAALLACASGSAATACALTDAVVIAIGESLIADTAATIIMRSQVPVATGGKITLGRYGSVYLVRLHRAGADWTVKCATNVPTDSSPDPQRTALRCPP